MTAQVNTRHRGPPAWFLACGWMVPAGVFAQFVSAGLGLFLDAQMLGAHAAVGISLSLPLTGLLAGSVMIPRLRGLLRWTVLATVIYGVQIMLAAGAVPALMALHPANGALLLATSLILLARALAGGRRDAAAAA